MIARGTFSLVYKVTAQDGCVYAVKRIKLDKKSRNREYEVFKEIDHMNVVKMHNMYYQSGKFKSDIIMNIVMDFIPMTISDVMSHFKKLKQPMYSLLVKLYSFQLLKGLNYLHSVGYMHRDVKPLNCLIDPTCHVLKICDLGSAKSFKTGNPDEKSVTYIQSRYYRAPECIFGNENYTYTIDIWSIGCTIAEMVKGSPLFKGENAQQQMICIIQSIGTPKHSDFDEMAPNFPNKEMIL